MNAAQPKGLQPDAFEHFHISEGRLHQLVGQLKANGVTPVDW